MVQGEVNDTMASFRRIGWGVLRGAIGLGIAGVLIYFTLRKTGADPWQLLAASDKRFLALMFMLPGAYLGLGAFRWFLLLNVQGIELKGADAVRLCLIGFFFNLAIPGAVGGDLVKMAHLARHTPGKRTEVVFTSVVDRLLGLMGLFILAGVMVLISIPSLRQLDEVWLQAVTVIVALGSLGGLLGVVLIELRGKLIAVRWISALVDAAGRWLPRRVVQIVMKMTNALELFRCNRRAVAMALLLSVAVHFTIAVTLFCGGAALGEQRLGFGDYVLTTQVANAVAAVPITPAGLGTRDAVVAALFSGMGAVDEKAGAIPVMFSLSILLWGIIGGGVFTLSPRIRYPVQSEFLEK